MIFPPSHASRTYILLWELSWRHAIFSLLMMEQRFFMGRAAARHASVPLDAADIYAHYTKPF